MGRGELPWSANTLDFLFCLANIFRSKWTFREHLFLLPLSLLSSGRLRLGWPHFWSEDFLSDPSPIIALSCPWVTHSLNALVKFCSNWICQSCYTGFSMSLDRFVKIDTCISLSCYMDLSKLIGQLSQFLRCFKVVLCISCPLANKAKLKFDRDFKFF